MDHFKIFREKVKNHIISVDPYAALGIFIVSALCMFVFCFANLYPQNTDSTNHNQHHKEHQSRSEFHRSVPESSLRRFIPPPAKNERRKRRFVKKEIKHMENDERNRKKEEKREESKAERNKQKKADSGAQKQHQKTNLKRIASGNGLENGGGRSKQPTTVRNVPRKRS